MSHLNPATALRLALADRLRSVTGIGTVDLARFDPDNIPRRLISGPTPYWSLSVGAGRPQGASFGMGTGARQYFQFLPVRLEGWRLIAALDEDTQDWSDLCEAAANAVLASVPVVARAVPGLLDLVEFADAPDMDVVGWPEHKSRAHHCRWECKAQVFVTVTV